jgi:membrane protease YdiL (CAAX protease family)
MSLAPDLPGRRFLRVLPSVLGVVIGLPLFASGVALNSVRRTNPEALPLALSGVAFLIILVGGGAFCAGVAPILFRWRGSLSVGSHRSIVGTTVFAVVLAAMLVAVFLTTFPGRRPDSLVGFLFVLLSLEGILVLSAYLQGVRSGLITVRALGVDSNPLRRGVYWGLVGGLALLILSLLNSLGLQLFGLEQPQAASLRWMRDLPGPQYLLIAVGGALLAPAVEELYFRGYVFNAYLAEKGRALAYVASALLFAIVHGQPVLVPALFGMGLLLAFIYRRSGTIVAAMVAHALNNSVAFGSLLLSAG